ncbi:MAG: GNAT family N-acetyltransferase [Desulfatiglandales bacterium]
MDEIKLSGYVPGAIGRVAELHAVYYSKHWGFGLFFESKVATELSEFLNRFNDAHDGFCLATVGGDIVGSIAIDGAKSDREGAHLRWFIVAPDCQGRGVGSILIRKAIEFCRNAHFNRVYLWTFAGLDPARHLYEKHGFSVCEEHQDDQWGVSVTEQMFELIL